MGNFQPVHRHEVITHEKGEEDGELECGACGKEIPGQISSWCAECKSYFHEGCAKLEHEIKLFFHTCPLFIRIHPPSTCNSCFVDITKGYTYRCEKCNFSMCVVCALVALSLATCDRESEEERILHPCHRHPLKPLPVEPNSLLSCQICHVPCSSTPTWGCEPCNFHLHKPCLDFLPQMVHVEQGSELASWGLQTFPYQKCVDCGKSIHSNLLFHIVEERKYTCLCILCCLVRKLIDKPSSQVPKIINHPIHPCPDLKLILSPFSTCNACFLSLQKFSYHCNSCDFFLCFDCGQLPHFFQWHPLKLLTGTEDTISTHICHLCEKFCSESFYSCFDLCQFYVHKSCIDSLPHKTTHLLLNKPIVLLHVPSFECTTCNRLCSGLTFYCSELKWKFCVKCVLWPENVPSDDGRFNSVLHWHQLDLCETRIEDKRRRCFLCKELCIAWSLCYKCTECALFFHKSCAELPAELEHPIHPHHRLTLTNMSSSFRYKDMTCELCLKSFSRNFPLCDLVYWCEECHFWLDTQCATFRPSVEYERHPHLLYVVANMHGDTFCRECGELCEGSCTIHCADQECDFSLHLQCSLLPLTVKHACHIHPLVLKEYYVEDNGSDEFACHICEEERDPRLRVYCCSRGCLMICDVKCVLNEVLLLLRGERGEVELRTPFPQVSCRVFNNQSDFAQLLLDSPSESDEVGDGDEMTNHVFCYDELMDSFPELDVEKNSDVENSDEKSSSEIGEEDETEEEISDGETETSSASENVRRTGTSLEKEVQRYSFSWKALSHFTELLHSPPFDPFGALRYLGNYYDESIVTGAYALPEEFGPIYEEFFGMYNIIDHRCNLNYAQRRLLVFVTCYVLHEMRTIKVVDVEKEKIKEWFGWIRFVEERGIFNAGILAENIKKVWKAHYYIQSRKIVEDKSSRLERELEQVSMYEAELRTKMDELRIKMYKAEARHQKLLLKEKEHEIYRVVGSRGPMKKARSDALEIKWRSCFDSVVTYPENFPAK